MKFEGDSTFAICMETANWSHPLPRCLGEYCPANVFSSVMNEPIEYLYCIISSTEANGAIPGYDILYETLSCSGYKGLYSPPRSF